MNAEDISKARAQLNLTQEEFAELLDVTTRTVQNWEAGKSSIKAKHESIIRKWLLVFKDGMKPAASENKSDFSRLIGVIEELQRQNAILTSIIERAQADNI